MTECRSSSFLRKQQIWVLAVGGLFVADFVLYGYLPSRERLQAVTEAKTQQMQVIRTAESRNEVLDTLKARLKKTDQQIGNMRGRIPDERGLGLFLGQIAQLMTKHGLSDQDVVFGRESVVDDLVCIPVQMKCSGDLAGVFGFFTDLQDLGRLVRIERTTLTNTREYSGAVVLEADAAIFYRPQTAQEASRSAKVTLWDDANDGT
jgi:Tfp pilus assembly protein PilO